MYEEKEFEDGLWYRTVAGGAWAKKDVASHPFIELLNVLQKRMGYKSRSKLLFALHIDTATVSRLKSGQMTQPSAKMILMIHDISGMSIEDIRTIGKIPKLYDIAAEVKGSK